jgi:hypothetical protein
MPGPSYSWSAFADSAKDAVAVVQSNRMLTLVIERLDESLVVSNNHSSADYNFYIIYLLRHLLGRRSFLGLVVSRHGTTSS